MPADAVRADHGAMSGYRWPAVGVLVLILVAGCGSDDSTSSARLPPARSTTPTVDRAFWARADVACGRVDHWFDSHPQALAGFDPNAPTSASLRRFATKARSIPLYRPGAMTAIARRLGQPDGGSDGWSTVVTDFRRFDVLTARQVRDAAHGDVRAWNHDFRVKAGFLPRLGPDLVAAGAPLGNECVALLGS